jgi:hypothetical protein
MKTSIGHAYSKWCKQRFPLPTEQDVFDLEHKLSARFPDQYRRYLLEWNGGMFSRPRIIGGDDDSSVGHLLAMSGIHAAIDFAELANPADLALFEDNSPPIILPIGTTTANNLIMISMAVGEVDDGTVFLRTMSDENIYLSKTIEAFFNLLRDFEA